MSSTENYDYLGSSKYDGKIRRITLIKKVADMLNMEDGDTILYLKKDGDIIIRRESKDTEWIPMFENISPKSAKAVITSLQKMMELLDERAVDKKVSLDIEEIEAIMTKATKGLTEEERREYSVGLREMSDKLGTNLDRVKFVEKE
jgi:bifunctional DNA-binding transcriptional regulator/antitoxin component of YhaV-PrlF toxin-antitoxin module